MEHGIYKPQKYQHFSSGSSSSSEFCFGFNGQSNESANQGVPIMSDGDVKLMQSDENASYGAVAVLLRDSGVVLKLTPYDVELTIEYNDT